MKQKLLWGVTALTLVFNSECMGCDSNQQEDKRRLTLQPVIGTENKLDYDPQQMRQSIMPHSSSSLMQKIENQATIQQEAIGKQQIVGGKSSFNQAEIIDLVQDAQSFVSAHRETLFSLKEFNRKELLKNIAQTSQTNLMTDFRYDREMFWVKIKSFYEIMNDSENKDKIIHKTGLGLYNQTIDILKLMGELVYTYDQ